MEVRPADAAVRDADLDLGRTRRNARAVADPEPPVSFVKRRAHRLRMPRDDAAGKPRTAAARGTVEVRSAPHRERTWACRNRPSGRAAPSSLPAGAVPV